MIFLILIFKKKYNFVERVNEFFFFYFFSTAAVHVLS